MNKWKIIINILIFTILIYADEWTIDSKHVYDLKFSPSSYHEVTLKIPLKAVKQTTSISMIQTKGIIYPPAVALGPAVEITPTIKLENIATLVLPFEEGQLALKNVQIGVWYKTEKGAEPIVIDQNQCKINYDKKTVTLEIKKTGIYQVGTWQSLADNWPPANFSLQSPSSGTSIDLEKKKHVLFSWQKAVDPNRDVVKYQLIFATDTQLKMEVATIDCGVNNYINVSSFTIKTLLNNYLYAPLFWGVRAFDNERSTLSLQNFVVSIESSRNAEYSGLNITWGPWLTLPIDNSVTVVWQTSERASSELHYGATKGFGQVVKGNKNDTIHKLVAADLQPGITYYYKIISGNAESSVKTFVAPRAKDDTIKVGMYGDSRTFHSFHQVVVDAMAKHKPDFIINSGDIIENGNRLHEWYEQFLTPTSSVIGNIPFIACHGNHDGSVDGNMWNFVPLPESAPSPHDMYYYTFKYGPMVVIMIDTEVPYAKGSKQYEYMLKDLQKYHKSNWLVVSFHRPAYSSGVGHGGEENPKIAEELVVLFERYGVDIVLNGHDHFYERSEKEGIQYVLSGGGGAPSTFGGWSLNSYSVTYNNFVLCYNILKMSPLSYSLKTFTPEGKVLDDITIDGTKPQIDILQPEGSIEKIAKHNGKRQYYLDDNTSAFKTKKNDVFRIYFRAKDLDNDARISLFLSEDKKEGDDILIAEDISENDNRYYDWHVSGDSGRYYIYATINDGESKVSDYSHFRISITD